MENDVISLLAYKIKETYILYDIPCYIDIYLLTKIY